jgi:hypothetical protein
MNYYSFDLHELDRISRDGDLDDFTKAVLEKGLDAIAELDALKSVLEELDLSSDPATLEDELRTVYYDWDCDRTELKTVKDDLEALKHEQSI